MIRVADIPIEELIGETWEGVLTRLTSDMDPWNIDLSELARRYRAYLRVLQDNDFEIPGRMVLTCSVLLPNDIAFAFIIIPHIRLIVRVACR